MSWSPLALCSAEFRDGLLKQVNANILVARRLGVDGVYPLSMRDLHVHVRYTCIFLFFLCVLCMTGLLFPVVAYGTVLAVLTRAAP